MKQLIQEVGGKRTRVVTLPDPVAGPGQVLVAHEATLISAGTERSVVQVARGSLLQKARARPDQVRRVVEKVRQEGVRATATQVRAKLGQPLALGYSGAGTVLACGRGVQEFEPGDRVATAGPHAGVVALGRRLCARVPPGVTAEEACFAGVGAIALEGVRLAGVTLGSRVLVIGLGLIGQMAVCLLKAAGCRVFGTELDPARLALARDLGADAVGHGAPLDAIRAFSDGHGVDAAIICAATSSEEPISLAAEACRVRGRVVLVGVAGMEIPRPPFFKKELSFSVSGSLGPGRWDPEYEEKGRDYPIGHCRWTLQRNMGAVLDAIATGALPPARLTTHRFPIDEATKGYDLIAEGSEPHLGIVVTYPRVASEAALERRRFFAEPRRAPLALERTAAPGIGVIGAGNFAQLVLLPILGRATGVRLRGIASARGLAAARAGQALGFAYAATDAGEILADPETRAVVIATRHDQHADLVLRALAAGKHVFVEKPLCLTEEQLEAIEARLADLGEAAPMVMVGFNRRFAPATASVKRFMAGARPLAVTYRFAPGSLPPEAWPQDDEVGGGRIVGEACHAIDTCVALTGELPTRVFAESVGPASGLPITDDRVAITLRHEAGSLSAIAYLAGGDKGGPRERVEVFGGERTAVIDGWDRVELYRGGRRTRERAGHDKGHAAEIAAFVEAVKRGGPSPIPWPEVRAVTAATLAAVASLRHGERVDVA